MNAKGWIDGGPDLVSHGDHRKTLKRMGFGRISDKRIAKLCGYPASDGRHMVSFAWGDKEFAVSSCSWGALQLSDVAIYLYEGGKPYACIMQLQLDEGMPDDEVDETMEAVMEVMTATLAKMGIDELRVVEVWDDRALTWLNEHGY